MAKKQNYDVIHVQYPDSKTKALKDRQVLSISKPNRLHIVLEVTDVTPENQERLRQLMLRHKAEQAELMNEIGAQWKSFDPDKLIMDDK